MLSEGVLSIAIRADFLVTPEKRKKSGIGQILTSACCPRQNEHINIKKLHIQYTVMALWWLRNHDSAVMSRHIHNMGSARQNESLFRSNGTHVLILLGFRSGGFSFYWAEATQYKRHRHTQTRTIMNACTMRRPRWA